MSAHRLYTLHALSPLHPGTGSGVGLIDLPIARERTTQHPLVPGSSVKGILRDATRGTHGDADEQALTWKLYGPDRKNAEKFASALRVSDARVLLFPVPSDSGTFAWITCPMVLRRLQRDVGALGGVEVPALADKGRALVVAGSALVSGDRVTLDGLPFEAEPSPELKQVAAALGEQLFDDPWWRAFLEGHLAMVHDDRFSWLVQQATDVRAHIAIDPERGTVAKGALWYEETLPPETVLAGVLQVVGNGKLDVAEGWSELRRVVADPLQVGGKATTGEGVVRVRIGGEA